MIRSAVAQWQGNLVDGKGTITTESHLVENLPYGFKTRFEAAKGTNPEELIGAAHAACFTMALAAELQKQNLTADNIETRAEVSLEKKDEGWHIPMIHLIVSARVPEATEAQLIQAAEKTKDNCPVSKLLRASITLQTKLLTWDEKRQMDRSA